MRHRLLFLSVIVVTAVLLAAGGRMIAVEGAPASGAVPPTACMSDPPQDADASASMEPVTPCWGGCPSMGGCLEPDDPCQCVNGPGHCVACGSQNQYFKCVKD